MCHDHAISVFPQPGEPEILEGELTALAFGDATANKRLAIIPDIYGCNPFYRGFAAYWAGRGARVFLMDPFAPFGELPEATREAAFARRAKLRDKAYLDAFERFLSDHKVDGVIGFCLGGLYVFELARRGYGGDLVAFYPFPQGLPNQDPLPTPFEYLGHVERPHLVLIGDQDGSVGPDNVARLAEVARANPAIELHRYPGSQHGFLADLDSEDATLRANARDALAKCEAAILGT